ncbi:MAG: hemerythrin cation binding region [Polaromonas sp.]|nr:hemerythrin cation binding region [Polaromonas sp.]MDB5939813.1 hemerythrin cation binding region [Polaromonas sp.]
MRTACCALATTNEETAIKHTSLQIIRDEHSSLAAMLKSMTMMVERGPGDNPEQFFDVLRAMLFYIDEFPERLHHPKESDLLFPRVVRASPSVMDAVQRLESDHMNGEKAVRELQHLLLAWELLGEPRKSAFKVQCTSYVKFYLEHMRLEETVILPEAERVLSDADWKELDAAFEKNCDPLTGKYPPDPAYDRLFTRIVMRAPAPIGLGNS